MRASRRRRRPRSGPASSWSQDPWRAGADPGPACYGRGGTNATVTDANLLLGRLNPAYFADGRIALDWEAAARTMDHLGRRFAMAADRMAAGILDLANLAMAEAV